MGCEVEVVEVTPTVIAAVRQRVAMSELPRRVPQLLGEVWDFVKSARLQKAGHNVAVYRDPQGNDIEVECGVQVSGEFADAGRVCRSETPSGKAAHVVHIGPYSEMGKAYDAIKAFCEREGMTAGVHWEVYGDWCEDPAQLRTDVFGLLR
jgi:effector-binding domain-containing protein